MMINWNEVKETIEKLHKQLKNKFDTDIPEDMLDKVSKSADEIFNPVEALDAEQVKIFNEMKSLRNDLDEALKLKEQLEKKLSRYNTLNNFFTSSIELKHDLVNKVWRVNEKTGIIEVFNTVKAKEQMKELGLDEMLPPNILGNDD
ncbi:MAG TPA: hypothetical protein VI911_10510 [Patescibacteria group bacterium]|nr:hypothetical protein [Patescibacteria group bacterium]